MPAVAGVAIRGVMQQTVRDTLDRSFVFFSLVLLVFVSVIVAGMIYNGARIALEAEILGGLAAGETVLRFPGNQVADGTRVRPR